MTTGSPAPEIAVNPDQKTIAAIAYGLHAPGLFGFLLPSIVAELVLGVLATMIVLWFSRRREFRADAGSARLVGPAKMIAALERLKANVEQPQLPQQMKAFGIAGGGGFTRLFMSHPPLDERIAALQAMH